MQVGMVSFHYSLICHWKILKKIKFWNWNASFASISNISLIEFHWSMLICNKSIVNIAESVAGLLISDFS